jgi:carbon-monoxide dehydrogenase medium subunit
MRIKQQLFPKTIEECIALLVEHEGKARVLAGGTDLFLWLKEGKAQAETLVDISLIEELKHFESDDKRMILGAALTHAEVAAHETVKSCFVALADGCRNVGSPQIRNIGTLGGNIVSAQPAADAVVPLVAMNAKCMIISASGKRTEDIENLFKGVGKSSVDPSRELITEIYVSKPAGRYGTGYVRMAPRDAMALPVVNAAVMVVARDGTITEARIVTSPVAVVPFRTKRAESSLIGKHVDDLSALGAAAQLAEREAQPRDSKVRGSGEYRKSLVKDIVERALIKAVEQIG